MLLSPKASSLSCLPEASTSGAGSSVPPVTSTSVASVDSITSSVVASVDTSVGSGSLFEKMARMATIPMIRIRSTAMTAGMIMSAIGKLFFGCAGILPPCIFRGGTAPPPAGRGAPPCCGTPPC